MADAFDDLEPEAGDDDAAPGLPDPPGDMPDDERALLERLAREPLNDTGNGARLVARFGHDLLFVPRVGWFVWAGTHWEPDPDELMLRRVGQKVGPRIVAEVPFLEMSEADRTLFEQARADAARLAEMEGAEGEEAATERARILLRQEARKGRGKTLASRVRAHVGFARGSGNSGPITNMAREAQVSLARPLDALDADPMVVNTQAGALRFSRVAAADEGMSPVADVTMEDHARGDLLSKILAVGWDPAAACPRFDDFMAEVQPDPAMRAFLARWLGLSMTGITEQRLAFFHGAGANGKSVLMDLMGRILGSYSTTARIETLVGRNRRSGGDATPDLMPLIGARMVRASEPEEGERLNEAIIKAMTGGEPFLARGLHADFVEVVPRFKLTISGNHKPEIRGTDDGIWRRVMLVPWDVQIPEARRDQQLVDKLFVEGAGVLNWLAAGLIDYLEGGLRVPGAVQDATDGYREDSDPMGRFLAGACEVVGEEGVFTPTKDIVDAFLWWLGREGFSLWTRTTVQKRLAEKAGRWRDRRTGMTFTPHKASISGYQGLRLTALFARQYEEGRHLDQRGGERGYKDEDL